MPPDNLPSDNLVQAVEQTVLCRKLNLSEQTVLLHAFQGHDYDTMARDSSYAKGYLKVIGSRLWKELSDALGQRVTKKNASAVLIAYVKAQKNFSAQSSHPSSPQPVQTQPVQPQSQIDIQTGTQTNTQLSSETGKPHPFNAPTPPYPPLAGPVPLDSPFYIARLSLESQAYQAIEQPGCLLRLKAPRLYGKSSLLLRLLHQATGLGFRPVLIDFQDAERSTLNDIDRLLRWLCANITQQLQLSVKLSDVWNADLGTKLNCKAFLQEQVLATSAVPVLLALNEVNYIFQYPDVAQDFLPLIRSCYEQARHSEQWKLLRWVMAYSTEVYVPLRLNQSPFNVGTALVLPPFTVEQAKDLAKRYHLQSLTSQQLSQLMALLGGQPYLLNIAFHALSVKKISLDLFFKTAPTLAGIYKTHLQHYLTLVRDQPDLIAALKAVLSSDRSVQIDPMAAYKLDSIGLVTLEGYQARMSCRLYRDYFEQVLQS